MTLVSAHRCLTAADIEAAIALGADYVEFDVQRCADGSLVLHHDPVDEAPDGVLGYDAALDLLAGRAKAHLDLKFEGDEVPVVARAVERLGTDDLLVTTLHDDAVRSVRDWADAEGHPLEVGLSLGRGVGGFRALGDAQGRGCPRSCRACATTTRGPTSWSRTTGWRGSGSAGSRGRRGLPLVVWTVDTPGALEYWMRPGRAWLVTTNEPGGRPRACARPDRLWP